MLQQQQQQQQQQGQYNPASMLSTTNSQQVFTESLNNVLSSFLTVNPKYPEWYIPFIDLGYTIQFYRGERVNLRFM